MSDQEKKRKGKGTHFFRNEGEGWNLIARLTMRAREGGKLGALKWMDRKLPSSGRNVQDGQTVIARLCQAASQTFEELQERGSLAAKRIQLNVFQLCFTEYLSCAVHRIVAVLLQSTKSEHA